MKKILLYLQYEIKAYLGLNNSSCPNKRLALLINRYFVQYVLRKVRELTIWDNRLFCFRPVSKNFHKLMQKVFAKTKDNLFSGSQFDLNSRFDDHVRIIFLCGFLWRIVYTRFCTCFYTSFLLQMCRTSMCADVQKKEIHFHFIW